MRIVSGTLTSYVSGVPTGLPSEHLPEAAHATPERSMIVDATPRFDK